MGWILAIIIGVVALITLYVVKISAVHNGLENDDALIFGKVRVADILTPNSGLEKGERMRVFNRIAKKHFDFVVCSKSDVSVLCAIELNDSSHNSKKRQQRDNFLENACTAAAFPLVQITAKKSYNVNDIQTILKPYIPILYGKTVNNTDTDEPKNPDEAENLERKCPKCSSLMVEKLASKGKNEGNLFWACSGFPKCRYTENI